MYVIDDNLIVSNPIPNSSSARNTGLKRRHGICNVKPTFNRIGRLHVDVFSQRKYMSNGVIMKVIITHSKDTFVLMAYIVLQSRHINGKIICEKFETHTKPGTRTHSPTKDDKVHITRVECRVIHLPQSKRVLHTITYCQPGSTSHDNSARARGQPCIQR